LAKFCGNTYPHFGTGVECRFQAQCHFSTHARAAIKQRCLRGPVVDTDAVVRTLDAKKSRRLRARHDLPGAVARSAPGARARGRDYHSWSVRICRRPGEIGQKLPLADAAKFAPDQSFAVQTPTAGLACYGAGDNGPHKDDKPRRSEAAVTRMRGHCLRPRSCLLDRLIHHDYLLKFEAKSWRRKEAASRIAKDTTAD
jgi:hypothetical protein